VEKDVEFRMLMNNRPSSVVPGPSSSSATGNLSHHQQQQQHWSCEYRSHTLTQLGRLLPDETVLQNVLSEAVSGGSEYGQLIVISSDLFLANWLHIQVDDEDKNEASGNNSVDAAQKNNHNQFLAILDVDGRPVSGFTRRDFLAWLIHRLVHHNNQQQQTDINIGGGVQLTTAPLTGQLSFYFFFFFAKNQKKKERNGEIFYIITVMMMMIFF
jgi:hypothetical protein